MRLPIRLSDAPVGSYVLSLPHTARVTSLALKGTLSTVRNDHISDALVTNITGTSITLKNGVLLGIFEVCIDLHFENPTHLLAGVSSSHDYTANVYDSVSKLNSFVKVLDYPRARPRLLNLLAKYQNGIALPGKNLVPLTLSSITVFQAIV